MNPIKNLLLAVDFSEHSLITLQSAIYFCKENKSTLSLIHVVSELDKTLDDKIKSANQKMDELSIKVQNEKIEVPHVKVISGNIEDHVVAFAENINVDAIFIGSGNHHLKKHRLGGHAEAILRQSSIPVLIVKNMISPLHGKIACPIDLTVHSDHVLEKAIDYAKHVDGELVIIHAVEPAVYGFPGTGMDYLYAERNFFQEEAVRMDDFLKTFDFKGVPWTKKILLGPPAHEVSEYIKKFPFVMTITGSVSRTGLSRLILGSVAESITRNVDSPCLILKKKLKKN